MKINDKDLIRFAASSSPIDKEGFLFKKGATVGSGYQKRWFILKGNLLFYFEKRDDKEPIGLIILENYKVFPDASQKLGFSVTFNVPHSRDYQFMAEYEEDMVSWVKALEHASYDCLKKLVEELEKKLAEVKGESSMGPEVSGATPLTAESLPSVPVKEKPLIELAPDLSLPEDVPRVTHLDDEMREDVKEGGPPLRVCSETDLTSPAKNDILFSGSGCGSFEGLDRESFEQNLDVDGSLVRGSRLRGPVISVVTTQKDAKSRQSQYEQMNILEDIIGLQKTRERTSIIQESFSVDL